MDSYATDTLRTIFKDSPQRQRYNKKVGQFTIKFADCLEEISQVFKMRYDIFWGSSQSDDTAENNNEERWDVDLFDLAADHLIIIDDEINQVVGTYRLINSEETQIFYSQTEFQMDSIIELEGTKVECGRACIHPDYRNGTTIGLLWQGLGDYIRNNNIRWMFGCSSIAHGNVNQTRMIHQHLMTQYHVDTELKAIPENPMVVNQLTELNSKEERLASRILPPLLRTYLKLGAKICGHPHFDQDMNCIDYLTLLDTQLLHEDFEKRFC